MRSALLSIEALPGILLALFVCRAVLASAVVPPWQGPDEPTHFALVRLLAEPDLQSVPLVARPLDGDVVTVVERDIQRDVLRSMARHRWWEAYGGTRPEPPPTSFRQIQRLGAGTYSQPLYYGLGAAVLRIAPPDGIEAAYQRLRTLSILLGAVTLAFAWAGTRRLFGATVATGATAIAALHPQFLLTTISVNPDALLIFLGALIWWLVARVVDRSRPAMSLTLILVVAVAALLTKRNAVPLVAVAALIAIASLFTPNPSRIRGRSIAWSVAAAGAICLAGVWVVFAGQFAELVTFWKTALNIRRPFGRSMLPEAIAFGRLGIDYVWLVGGWLRYPAGEPWLWVVRIITIAGLGSAMALLMRSSALRRPLAIAWLLVGVQTTVVIGWAFLTLSSPQGRYLFPVIAPATALLWIGLTHATPASIRPYAAPALIALMTIVDVTGFTTVLAPAYLPWG